MAEFLQMKPLFKKPLLPLPSKKINIQRLERIFSINPQPTAILGYKNSKQTNFSKEDIIFMESEVNSILI